MGELNIQEIGNRNERNQFFDQILDDLQAFEIMLREGMIDPHSNHIGAEQEICLLDDLGHPSAVAEKLIPQINDRRYTYELALFNLEANLDPKLLRGSCFKETEQELASLMQSGNLSAADHGSRLLLCGILPTIRFRHLDFKFMTPLSRYTVISNLLRQHRGRDFEVYLQGVDDFNVEFETILFEACNTSWQCHLQIAPDDFVRMHNWSQMIAGPVLATAVNSPLLFGRELWAETRIALFKQSMDTRSTQNYMRKSRPRVFFGWKWLEESPVELWKMGLTRFPVLVKSDQPSSLGQLQNGEVPSLRSVRLHNGTTYTWNRMCYGRGGGTSHLRIECRYLPAGPTMIDEIANFAFWVGLMQGMPEEKNDFWKTEDFKVAKSNFIRAARSGLETVFNWFGKSYSAQRLILEELLPMAYDGLYKLQVDSEDITRYLKIIESRVSQNRTGARWQVDAFRLLEKKHTPARAVTILTNEMWERQQSNIPVADWSMIKSLYTQSVHQAALFAEDVMQTDLLTVDLSMSHKMAQHIMRWNKIHHLPVEDSNGRFVGCIVDEDLKDDPDRKADTSIEDLVVQPVTVAPTLSLDQVEKLMKQHGVTYCAVVIDDRLQGIVTTTDLKELT